MDDYHIQAYAQLLENAIRQLPGLIDSKAFIDQMTRFIDADTLSRTLHDPHFAAYLKRTVGQTLGSMAAHLNGKSGGAGVGFRM